MLVEYMDDNSKMDWINVILLKDFVYYLDIETLKEVSLLSKVVREKLNQLLFRNLRLSVDSYGFGFKNNMFIEYFRRSSDPDFKYTASKRVKGWNFKKGLTDFTFSLKTIKLFAVSFNYTDMKKAGYYLIPILNGMNNLVILNLRYSSISYSSFTNLGELLPNLKDIELYQVIFIKLSKDDGSLNNKFPPYLRTIKIDCCDIFIAKSFPIPYKFLFNENTRGNRTWFQLPNTSIPFLKKLSYQNGALQCDSLEQFLEINPELEFLKIEFFTLKLNKRLTLLNSLEFDTLVSFDNSAHIHSLESLKNLKINSVLPIYYESISYLCLLCPNLEYLYFKMIAIDYLQSFIDSFLVPILTNLAKLKTLELVILSSENENLDIKKISNIETLIIETRDSTISNLIFDAHSNLKNVIFKSFRHEVNSQQFKDKFNSHKNWLFKFDNNTITGNKVE